MEKRQESRIDCLKALGTEQLAGWRFYLLGETVGRSSVGEERASVQLCVILFEISVKQLSGTVH